MVSTLSGTCKPRWHHLRVPPAFSSEGPSGRQARDLGSTDTLEVHTYQARPGGRTGYEQVTGANVQTTLGSPGSVCEAASTVNSSRSAPSTASARSRAMVSRVRRLLVPARWALLGGNPQHLWNLGHLPKLLENNVWFFLWSCYAACGIFLDQGSNLHWEPRVLTTGPSEKSHSFLF